MSHSWECLASILEEGHTRGIVCDIGMPVIHRGVRYNCRIFCLDGRILLIRPKLYLANDGNYREPRYFAAWKHRRQVERHMLPSCIRTLSGQHDCPFGDAALQFDDTTLASETCEELFTPASPHIDLALSGVEIIANGSGSHHQLRKLKQRMDLLLGATAKTGGVYLYANQQGCDGGRLYYDGCACVAQNGKLIAQGSQFSVRDVEVVTATVNLDDVVSFRGSVASLQEQASTVATVPFIDVPFCLCVSARNGSMPIPNDSIEPRYLCPEEEIARGPACWLWDYLRRSGASGYLLPLSGGADSSSVAAIVGCMCQMVYEEGIQKRDPAVLADIRKLCCKEKQTSSVSLGNEWLPTSPSELASRLFTTLYLGTENSSNETKDRAALLASQIGAMHIDAKIDSVVTAMTRFFSMVTGRTPRFRVHGGSGPENLALQNIQARLRMVVSFMMAQLLPWTRGNGSGFLLVLGSSNVDETLRGYLTKYDCSAADINPIGGISKSDLKRFLIWANDALGYSALTPIAEAPPTAELEPLGAGGVLAQTDEVDMGMTYSELSLYGALRKVSRLGPVSMFRSLLVTWGDSYSPSEIAAKVKHFFRSYAMNRHKATVLPPSYHAENYSPDDNRYDHRQFLYNVNWPWQFRVISRLVQQQEAGQSSKS